MYLDLGVNYIGEEDENSKHYFVEKTLDNYLLYCQRNALKFGPALSQFFTTIHFQVWILLVIFSVFFFFTKFGGGNGLELIVSFLKQPISG